MFDPMQRAPAGDRGSKKSLGGDTDNDTAPSLFDDGLETGRRRRDEGARVAELGSWSPWRRRAERWIVEMASTGIEFSADDLMATLGRPVASSPQSIGSLFLSASKRGLIRKTGYQASRNPSRNASVIATWVGTGATPRDDA